MTRKPRVVWLVDDRAPTGATVMALRRAAAVGERAEQAVMALRPGPRPGRGTALSAIVDASSIASEFAIARADIVFTTSELTLASAVARRTGRGRLVHVVHRPAVQELALWRIARNLPAADWLLVPAATDVARIAGLVPLPTERVQAVDDFVPPAESMLSSARGTVVLAAGRIGSEIEERPEEPILDLVDGFALALSEAPDAMRGWQLRIAGGGPALPALLDHVDRHALASHVHVLGPCPDLSGHYLDAGVVARLDSPEANGLSVVEGLAAGVPVLSSSASPAAVRHVRDGENGTMLDTVDPVAIAAALVELADPDRRAAYAHKVRADRVGLLDDTGRRREQDRLSTVLDSTPSARRTGRRP